MNTDDFIQRQDERTKEFNDKQRYTRKERIAANAKCSAVKNFVRDQNTVYDAYNNRMLYGIDSYLGALGVGDGKCSDQTSPLLRTPQYMCGFGAAGGNQCVKDYYEDANNFYYGNARKLLEGFNATNMSITNDDHDMIIFVIIVLIVLFCIYMLKK